VAVWRKRSVGLPCRSGWPVLASYGMTETGSQIATQSPSYWIYRIKSRLFPCSISGTFPLMDGRLSVAGPALFSGSATIEAGVRKWQPRTDESHTTVDRVLVRERELTPLGRVDSVVKVLGELVHPEAIERDLMGLSGDELKPVHSQWRRFWTNGPDIDWFRSSSRAFRQHCGRGFWRLMQQGLQAFADRLTLWWCRPFPAVIWERSAARN